MKSLWVSEKQYGFFRVMGIIMFFGCITIAGWTIGNATVEAKTEPIPAEDQLKQMIDKTMWDFALAIKAKDFTGFYQNVAERWQAQITKDDLDRAFKKFIDQDVDLTVLQHLEPVLIEPPTIDRHGLLVLEGYYPSQPSFTNFTLKYLYEEPDWKLFVITVRLNQKPLSETSTREAIPTDRQLKTLVEATIIDFAIGVKARDFTGFYQNISRLWQAQTTPQELTTSFSSFTGQNIDLTLVQGMDPIFVAEPFLNENGWLVLQGYYPTQPSITYFTLTYLYEESEWRLGVIDLKVTQDPPPDSLLKAMVNTTMLDFALAVNAKDFTDFYATVADLWQAQTTPEALDNAFKVFSDQNLDFTVLQEFEPQFTEPPFFDDDGWLILRGQYPTQPSVVYFDLQYLFEETAWRLVSINIDVK